MAIPVPFFGSTNVIPAGKGTEDRVTPLPAFVSPGGEVISRWKLSDAEKQLVLERGEVWLSQMTFRHPLQPALVSGYPLMEMRDGENNVITYVPDHGIETPEGPQS